MNFDDLALFVVLGALLAAGVAGTVWWYRRQRRIARREARRAQHSVSGSRDMLGEQEIAVRHMTNPDRLLFGHLVDIKSRPVVTDRPVVDDTDAPVAVFGAPGSGKTVSALAPAIVRHRGPALVSTTKTDLARSTFGARAITSAPVIFDPAGDLDDSTPDLHERVRVWTPITEGVTWARAQRTAHAMLTAVKGTEQGGQQAFFVTHSTIVVAAMLVYLRARPGSSLLDLIEQVKRLGASATDEDDSDAWEDLLRSLTSEQAAYSDAAELGDASAVAITAALEQARLALSLTAGAARAEETRAGILGSVAQIIEGLILAGGVLRQKWDDTTTLRLDTMPDQHTLYLVCPTPDYRPLTNALLGAYIEELQRRAAAYGGALPNQHLVVLDELVHCTPHRDLQSWAANIARSARIKFMLCTQSVSDLIAIYGREGAAAIRNACSGGQVLFAATTDSETTRAYSELAGKRELVQEQSVSISVTKSSNYSGMIKSVRDGSSTSKTTQRSRQLVEKDAATPSRLAAMQTFHALVWLPGRPDVPGGTVQVRATPLFEDPDLLAASHGDPAALARVQRLPDTSAWETRTDAPQWTNAGDDEELDEAA